MDQEENRVNQRPQINPLRALADLQYSNFASSRLRDSRGEEEVSRPTIDGILPLLRGREMKSDTISNEREATMKIFIEGIYRKTRNGTLVVPKTRVAATYMLGGMKVLKHDRDRIKADGRTVEKGS